MPESPDTQRFAFALRELRREAARSRNAQTAQRMLAIALALEGHPHGDAAAVRGMDRQTLRDGAHRCNAERIAGLSNRRAPGPGAAPFAGQEAELHRLGEEGADLARDGVVRRRCRDLRARVERGFGVGLHGRTVGKLLARPRSGSPVSPRSIRHFADRRSGSG